MTPSQQLFQRGELRLASRLLRAAPKRRGPWKPQRPGPATTSLTAPTHVETSGGGLYGAKKGKLAVKKLEMRELNGEGEGGEIRVHFKKPQEKSHPYTDKGFVKSLRKHLSTLAGRKVKKHEIGWSENGLQSNEYAHLDVAPSLVESLK